MILAGFVIFATCAYVPIGGPCPLDRKSVCVLVSRLVEEAGMMGGNLFRSVALLAALLFLLAIPNARAQCDAATDSHGSSAYEASHLIKAAPGVLCNLTVNFHTAAFRAILLIDASAIPADAALPACDNAPIGTACVRWCFEGLAQATDPAESVQLLSWGNTGLNFNSGIVVAASTSTSGCTTLTSDTAHEWYDWQAR